MKNLVGKKLFILPSNVTLVVGEKVWWDVNLPNKMWIYQLSYWRKSLMGCEFIKQNVRLLPHIHWRSQGSKSKGQHGKLQVRTTLLLSVKLRLRLWQVAFSFVSFLFRFHAFWRNVITVYVRYIEPNHKCWLLYRKQYICILFTDPHVLKLHTISTVNAETPYDFLGLPKCAKRFRTFVPWD